MKYLLIDGNSVLNRAFYGVRPLTNKAGLNTNAIYGFLNILFKHWQRHRPDGICVAFDLKDKTFRHLLYDGYKAGRKGMPEELAEQLPVIKNVLDALNIARLEISGFEADDIIGTLSAVCEKNGHEAVIVSGDRDELQLISDLVSVDLATTKNDSPTDTLYNTEKILEKYGVEPKQLIDVKALMGDQSDNIPGVAGIGEKTALSLIKEFGSIDAVYEKIEDVKGATKQKLITDRDNAYLSRTLGEIKRDVPLEISLEDITSREPNAQRTRDILTELELYSILKKIPLKETVEEKTAEGVRPAEVSDFTENDLALFEKDKLYFLKDGGSILLKCEDGARRIDEKAFLELLAEYGGRTYTFDAKPLILKALSLGLKISITFDALLAEYVNDPAKSRYTLEALCLDYTQHAASEPAEQIVIFPSICERMEEEIAKRGQEQLFYEIEMPLCGVLAEMEHIGFALDRDFVEEFGEELSRRISGLESVIYLLAGREFNINSTKQLAEILFTELGLKAVKKTKTGYSTNSDVLEALRYEHPIIENIIEYRALTKLRSTYVDGLLDKVGEDGRIRSVFNQTVTQTGRISSSEPNLQNIPVRTELGRLLRKAFVAREGYLLIDADYSQIELRMLAHMAKDEEMSDAFIKGADIHTRTAAQVFGIPEQMVTSDLRRKAKAVNFGIVYGIGEFSLSKDLGVSRKEAGRYIESYLSTYKGVRDFMERTVAFAKENGFVETVTKRRRYIAEINMKNHQMAEFGKRAAMNAPIQGSAADLIKIAMVRCAERLEREGLKARLILQVHDELIVEAPENEAEAAKKILTEEMENAMTLSVPLLVDCSIGNDWYSAKE